MANESFLIGGRTDETVALAKPPNLKMRLFPDQRFPQGKIMFNWYSCLRRTGLNKETVASSTSETCLCQCDRACARGICPCSRHKKWMEEDSCREMTQRGEVSLVWVFNLLWCSLVESSG